MSVIAVVGASGKTGRLTTDKLTEQGHEVVAVCRTNVHGVRHVPTDILDEAATRSALRGCDAVIVALGIAENPLRIRFRGAGTTSSNVRSLGTANVLAAMHAEGIGRLVVLSSYGVGDSASGLSLSMRAIFAAILAPQIRDHLRQEDLVRASATEWTIARPVNVRDEPMPAAIADPYGRTVSMNVARTDVADYLATAATSGRDWHHAVALSA
jgi:nucleoside-diphosphate-sugar epimerase